MNWNEVFSKNATFFAKRKNIKLSDMYSSVGLSKGYLSRNPSLSLNHAVEIANYLHCDLNSLLDTRFIEDLINDDKNELLDMLSKVSLEELKDSIKEIEKITKRLK